jgi:hypothetical protein
MRITRQENASFTIIVTMAISALVLSTVCSSCNQEAPVWSGTLFLSNYGGDKCAYYDVATGALDTVNWPHDRFDPIVLCRGDGDTLLVLSNIRLPYTGEESNGQCIYKWVPETSEPVLFQNISAQGFNCASLDYYEPTKQYLHCGYRDGKQGVYLLDSYFELEEIITADEVPESALPATAFFLGESTYAISRSGMVTIVSQGKHLTRLPGSNSLVSISATRSAVLGCRDLQDGSCGYWLLDFPSLDLSPLDLPDDVCGAALSPDDRYVVYAHDPGFTGWRRVTVIELASEEKRDLGVYAVCKSVFWLIAASLPEAL